jgi:hypothetical protein
MLRTASQLRVTARCAMKPYVIGASLFVVAFLILAGVAISMSQDLRPKKPAAGAGGAPTAREGGSNVNAAMPLQARPQTATQQQPSLLPPPARPLSPASAPPAVPPPPSPSSLHASPPPIPPSYPTARSSQ